MVEYETAYERFLLQARANSKTEAYICIEQECTEVMEILQALRRSASRAFCPPVQNLEAADRVLDACKELLQNLRQLFPEAMEIREEEKEQ